MASDLDFRAALLKRVLAYCAENGMYETAFGRAAMGDGNFVGNLRRQRNMTTATLAKAVAFLDLHDLDKAGGGSISMGTTSQSGGGQ